MVNAVFSSGMMLYISFQRFLPDKPTSTRKGGGSSTLNRTSVHVLLLSLSPVAGKTEARMHERRWSSIPVSVFVLNNREQWRVVSKASFQRTTMTVTRDH